MSARPRWPAIVLRTPKGWTGPKQIDGVPMEGTFRAHQVPVAQVRTNPAHLEILEAWMKSYRPEELFDERGRLLPHLAALIPKGARRMGANPHANGGRVAMPLKLPDFRSYAVPVRQHGSELRESTRQLGQWLRDIYRANPKNFRLFCPDETNSNRLGAVFEVEKRCLVAPTTSSDEHVSPEGRVMEVPSEHNCEGWLEGYLLTGRHGLFATYEAFALIVASMTTQHAKWLRACEELPWRTPIPSLNILLTSTCPFEAAAPRRTGAHGGLFADARESPRVCCSASRGHAGDSRLDVGALVTVSDADAETVVLAINSGSSSLKCALFAIADGSERCLARAAFEGVGGEDGDGEARAWICHGPTRTEHTATCKDPAAALDAALTLLADNDFERVKVAGHRVVHGGPEHVRPAIVGAALLASLRRIVPLAPLHMPACLAGIEAIAARLPTLPQVVCFDTAFHATLSEVARKLPIPDRFTDVRRYGFHGLSYEYVMSTLEGTRPRGS